MKNTILLILLMLVCCAAVSEAGFFRRKPKEAVAMDRIQRQFDSISVLLEKADHAKEAGHNDKARQLYGATIAAYRDFHRKFPDSNTEVIKFRVEYCRNQLIKLLAAKTGDNVAAAATGKESVKSAKAAAQTHAVAPAVKSSKRNAAVKGGQSLPKERAIIISNIGLCRAGEYRQVKKNMSAFIRKNPDSSHAWLLLGTAGAGLGDIKGASKAIRRSLELDPLSAEAHYDLSQLLIRSDSPDMAAARKHYQRAVELGAAPDPDLETVLNL